MPRGRPKVAHIATVGMGVKFLLANQLKMLEEKGFEVWAICGPDEWVEEARREGIRVVTVPLTRSISPRHDLEALRALVRILRKEKFDIVHTHNPKPGFLGQVAAKVAKVPISVATIHGYYFVGVKSPVARAFFEALEAATVRLADLVFFQNRHDYTLSVKRGLVSKKKARYLGNGIDLSRFDPTKIPGEAVRAERRRLGIPDDAIVVGMVGRLVWEKGYREFLEASALVRSLERNVHFVVVGFREDFRRDAVPMSVIEKFERARLIKFLGRRDDMPLVYAMMDIVVLPSHREGFPRTLMEGAAMGKPVVATDVSGCREVVEVVGEVDGGIKIGLNGLLVPVGDSGSLAAAILFLARRPDWRRKMGEASRMLAICKFDESKVAEAVADEYRRLLGELSQKKQGTPKRDQTRRPFRLWSRRERKRE